MEREMRSGLDARLTKLERVSAAGRTVLVWEPDGEYDLGELRRRHGAGPNGKLFLLRWARSPTE